MRARFAALFVNGLLLATVLPAAALEDGPVELHGQSTYVWQRKPSFGAAYSGGQSLAPERARSYSLTNTLFLGVKLSPTLEAYFNPEFTQGQPFSSLQGLGGFPNGELARTSGSSLTSYVARAFVRKRWHLDGALTPQETGQNQVKTEWTDRRVVLTAGNLSVLDIFDAVAYSRDARTQFLNWSSLTYGAWDFPADARGYTWGAALEYLSPQWVVRAGRFIVPKESNGLRLDFRMLKYYGDVVELELPYQWRGRASALRMLAFRNHARMGAFDDALALGATLGEAPDLEPVRRPQSKRGFAIGVQQPLTQSLGGYVRAGWADGRTETYQFTEIDRSFAAGLLAEGSAWGRSRDAAGIAGYFNMLSRSHRRYLAAGGLGFFLGDGRLDYGPERIVEAFYRIGLIGTLALSLDWQHVVNPGYNTARGPVDFFGVRLHAEF